VSPITARRLFVGLAVLLVVGLITEAYLVATGGVTITHAVITLAIGVPGYLIGLAMLWAMVKRPVEPAPF
jgi:hypothetical protein